jgi:hypothetical protein
LHAPCAEGSFRLTHDFRDKREIVVMAEVAR